MSSTCAISRSRISLKSYFALVGICFVCVAQQLQQQVEAFGITSTSGLVDYAVGRHRFGRSSARRTSIRSTNVDDDFFLAGEDPISPAEAQALTIPQLKQQLRLRGRKVTGRKSELVERLMDAVGVSVEANEPQQQLQQQIPSPEVQVDIMDKADAQEQISKARRTAKENGKELIDVSAYLDDEDQGKGVKSSADKEEELGGDGEEDNDGTSSVGPEVWGQDAKIVDDYEGRSVVVDSLSRTLVEFKGSNQTDVTAFCVASRDALRYFLAGGKRAQNETSTAEQQLREIQSKREKDAKVPFRFEDDPGLEEGDETGIYKNIIERDFTDWGKFTQTGAQLSASEVQGVLLLSDVYGAFTEDTRALAEKIAFECQPVVVLVPDIFQGRPWAEEKSTPGLNARGQNYEQWRATHSDQRISIDIRAAASCLRTRYGVSSIAVWGTCFGGGRALEAASGYLPKGNIHDVDGRVGPPPVNPMVAIAWYPTRYNAKKLFGSNHEGTWSDMDGNDRSVAVISIFAGEDTLEGATPEDAALLKSLLDEDSRVKDNMVKVFPGQVHGFAHQGIASDNIENADNEDAFGQFVDEEFGGAGQVSQNAFGGDADVACLLSTAWMETYSRVFLPTAGPAVSKDDKEEEWRKLEMKDLSEAEARNVREEINDASENFVQEPLSGKQIDQTDEDQKDELMKLLAEMQDEDADRPLTIDPEDDLTMIYAKLKASDENFQIF